MLRILLTTFPALIMSIALACAQEQDTMLLDHPAEWRYEKIEFPLSFAADIDFKGVEELRFAPGMFDTQAYDYFTYVFVLTIENEVQLDHRELKDFLIEYYKGLCKAVAESNELDVDLSEITVEVKGKKPSRFTAEVAYLDTFNSGNKIKLNMDIEVIKQEDVTYLLALVSPKPIRDQVWHELYDIKSQLKSTRKEFQRQ